MHFNLVTKEIFNKYCKEDIFTMQKIINDSLKKYIELKMIDSALFYLISDDGSKYFVLESNMNFLYIPDNIKIDQNDVEITFENYKISKISDTTPYIKNEFMRGNEFMCWSSFDYENGMYKLENKLFDMEIEFGLMSEKLRWSGNEYNIYYCDSMKQKLPPFCNKLSDRLKLIKLIINEKGQKYQKSNI